MKKPSSCKVKMLDRAFDQTEKSMLNIPVRKSLDGKEIDFPLFAVILKNVISGKGVAS